MGGNNEQMTKEEFDKELFITGRNAFLAFLDKHSEIRKTY